MKVKELASVFTGVTRFCTYEDLRNPETVIRADADKLRGKTAYSEYIDLSDREIDYSFVRSNTVYARVVPIE